MTAQLATVHGWPLLPSLLVAGLVATPLGLLVALPALRLGTVYLALATLAFALLMENLVFRIDRFTGASGSGESLARPEIFGVSFESDLRLPPPQRVHCTGAGGGTPRNPPRPDSGTQAQAFDVPR